MLDILILNPLLLVILLSLVIGIFGFVVSEVFSSYNRRNNIEIVTIEILKTENNKLRNLLYRGVEINKVSNMRAPGITKWINDTKAIL